MISNSPHHRADLVRIATGAMSERGLESEFSASVQQQLATIIGPAREAAPEIQDLTGLPWCSIDNDDSLDLGPLAVCEVLAQGVMRKSAFTPGHRAGMSHGGALGRKARVAIPCLRPSLM